MSASGVKPEDGIVALGSSENRTSKLALHLSESLFASRSYKCLLGPPKPQTESHRQPACQAKAPARGSGPGALGASPHEAPGRRLVRRQHESLVTSDRIGFSILLVEEVEWRLDRPRTACGTKFLAPRPGVLQ